MTRPQPPVARPAARPPVRRPGLAVLSVAVVAAADLIIAVMILAGVDAKPIAVNLAWLLISNAGVIGGLAARRVSVRA